jgi:predicted small secreted protein
MVGALGPVVKKEGQTMKKIALTLALVALTGCATWEGIKTDVASGAGAVEESLN